MKEVKTWQIIKPQKTRLKLFLDLETELLKAQGIADLIRMLSVATSSGDSLESFENGIWLIGSIATDNAQRIEELVRMCDLA